MKMLQLFVYQFLFLQRGKVKKGRSTGYDRGPFIERQCSVKSMSTRCGSGGNSFKVSSHTMLPLPTITRFLVSNNVVRLHYLLQSTLYRLDTKIRVVLPVAIPMELECVDPPLAILESIPKTSSQ